MLLFSIEFSDYGATISLKLKSKSSQDGREYVLYIRVSIGTVVHCRILAFGQVSS